jgi:DNA polymerase-3 subunit delta'
MQDKNNNSIIGHTDILSMLSSSIINKRLAHAYLFLGPDNIGKKTLALSFAQAIQCLNKKQKPCLVCTACVQIQKGNHPDTQILSGTESLKIEEIRSLQHNLVLNPYNSPYKIAIIDSASRMTFEAQNAFLKTLEEPPGQTILILTVTNKKKLLPTILSRCQIIFFRNISTEIIQKSLEKRNIAKKQAEELARLSLGRPGLALRILKEPAILEKREEQIKIISNLTKNSILERFDLSATLNQKGVEEIESFIDIWLFWLRDLLLIKLQLINLITNIAHLKKLEQELKLYKKNELENLIERLEKSKEQIKYNVNLRLFLEALFLKIPRKQIES